MTAHGRYITGLLNSRKVSVAGPFVKGDGAVLGLDIMPGTPEEAKAAADADPAVKEGHFGYEILKWMGPEGQSNISALAPHFSASPILHHQPIFRQPVIYV